jgi:hypothetical protein
MNIKKIIFTCCFVSWCLFAHAELSPEILTRAKEDLVFIGKKETVFSKLAGYQDYATNGRERTFVVGLHKDKKYQVCMITSGGLAGMLGAYSREDLEKYACERLQLNEQTQAQNCEVYARDNEIVYEPTKAIILKAMALYKAEKNEELQVAMDRLNQRSTQGLTNESKGILANLQGLIAASKHDDPTQATALRLLSNSWKWYGFSEGALNEIELRNQLGVGKNWKEIREAYEFATKSLPEQNLIQIKQIYALTESYYVKDESQRINAKKADAENQLKQEIIRKQEEEFTRMKELAEVKKRQAENDRRVAERVREFTKMEQEAKQKQLAEEKLKRLEVERIARDGDGSPDDQRCKGYGLKPSSAGYAECRMRLDLDKRQATDRQRDYDLKQQEVNQRRLEQEARERAYLEEKKRRDALETIQVFQALQQQRQQQIFAPVQPTIIQAPAPTTTRCRSEIRGGAYRGGMVGGTVDTTCD